MSDFELGRKRFRTLYSGIFGEISEMLSKVKLMPIHKLTDEEPSLKKRAEELSNLKHILEELAPLLGVTYDEKHLNEYIDLAVEIGEAIDSECSERLGAAIAELDLKPYI